MAGLPAPPQDLAGDGALDLVEQRAPAVEGKAVKCLSVKGLAVECLAVECLAIGGKLVPRGACRRGCRSAAAVPSGQALPCHPLHPALRAPI